MANQQWLFAGLNVHRVIDAPDCYPDARHFTPIPCIDGAQILFSCWSQIVCKRSRGENDIVVKGFHLDPELSIQSGHLVKAIFGDYNGFLGYMDVEGRAIYLAQGNSSPERFCSETLQDGCRVVHAIALAGNNRVAVLWQAEHEATAHLHEFENLAHMKEASRGLSNAIPTTSAIVGDVKQLTANEGVFVCLLANGTVLTWGDPRYRALGRSPTPEEPAHRPGIVDSLGGVKIVKVSAGNWTWAALSEDGAVYICCPSGPTPQLSSAVNKDSEPGDLTLVTICDADGDIVDMTDIAIGAEHALVLTNSGAVFGIGDNRNGQMGVGSDDVFFTEWKMLYPAGCSAVEAAASHSLIRVER